MKIFYCFFILSTCHLLDSTVKLITWEVNKASVRSERCFLQRCDPWLTSGGTVSGAQWSHTVRSFTPAVWLALHISPSAFQKSLGCSVCVCVCVTAAEPHGRATPPHHTPVTSQERHGTIKSKTELYWLYVWVWLCVCMTVCVTFPGPEFMFSSCNQTRPAFRLNWWPC